MTQGTKDGPPAGCRRAYMLNLMRSRRDPAPGLISWIAELGFDTLLLALPRHLGSADLEAPPPIMETAVAAGLQVRLDLVLHIAGDGATIRRQHPDWYRDPARRFADPRDIPLPSGIRRLDPQAAHAEAFVAHWARTLRQWGESGVAGFRCKALGEIPPAIWRDLAAAMPGLSLSAWTPGETAEMVDQLPHGCFDVTYSSLAWWDFGSGWLRQELTRLRAVAPVAHGIGLQAGPVPGPVMHRAAERLLAVAASNGHGLLLPSGFEFGVPDDLTHPAFGADDWQRLRDHGQIDLTAALRQANRELSARRPAAADFDVLSGEDAPVAVLFERPGQLTLANRHLGRPARFDPSTILPILDGRLTGFIDAAGAELGHVPILLAPGETRVFTGSPAHPVAAALPREAKRKRAPDAARLAAATAAPRVVIEAVTPAVDDGRFAVKRVVGERIAVEADIFADGHGKIAAALQWRACDETAWREAPMQPLGNDRWRGEFLPERIGPHLFRVLGWPDRFATYRDELTKKRAAGLDVTLELEEGGLLLKAMAEAAPRMLDALLARLEAGGNAAERIALLTEDAAAALVAQADQRPGQAASREMPLEADRRAAQFASWYELFPRSQSGDPDRHGTFQDVIQQLPAIRDMGFDVLYFPPIHPIGRTNRKGRNNTLTPTESDPGSPYAIGAAEGGHDAIHPTLGTLDDFRALRDAAAAHGLELALDFAIQCSPDHPWLREHPEWFDWRPDGGLRYAENPPKKYEDIVNVDFYQSGAIPGLWLALRDVVAFWVKEGVRIFRVDNPHTKPFPFWEWLIADIRASNPEVLFLSEAFTRPKVMQRLAKLGFSQSYTYFTWRNEKREIEAYLRELTSSATGANLADFFRPNFFVNTPDINPVFLQGSGRAGFLIRAALATTLSGLWGMLQGYEFCEAEPIPGKEEYKDSDKYQIRARPARAPGDIVQEVTRLNWIRRANPALQRHHGLAFHVAANDRVLWYRKANSDRSNVVLVAVSLDPHAPQSAAVEVPLWEWGLGDDAALTVDDLMHGGTAIWQGKHRTIALDPGKLPFGIWRARPMEMTP